jgi:hypothetical protein
VKTRLIKLVCGLALLTSVPGVAINATAQSTFTATYTGTGSGNFGGTEFSDTSFVWAITFDTTNPNLYFGSIVPCYTILDSVIGFPDSGLPTANITQPADLMFFTPPNDNFMLSPITVVDGNPYAYIMGVMGSPDFDLGTPFTATTFSWQFFDQFVDITTDQGLLTMNSATLSQVTVTGVEPVPEPATLALAGLGALGCVLLFWRRES